MVIFDNCTILDHEFTYAEDDVSSGNVIVRMAHDALAEALAHGRVHNRQKMASLVSLIVEKVRRRGDSRREEKNWVTVGRKGEMGYTC